MTQSPLLLQVSLRPSHLVGGRGRGTGRVRGRGRGRGRVRVSVRVSFAPPLRVEVFT